MLKMAKKAFRTLEANAIVDRSLKIYLLPFFLILIESKVTPELL